MLQRSSLFAAGGFIAAVGFGFASEPPATHTLTPARIDLRQSQHVLASKRAYAAPPMFSSPPGTSILQLKLDVSFALNAIDRDLDGKTKDTVWLRSYNGKLVGPTIRVRPGSTLKIRLKNLIPDWAPDVFARSDPNRPNGFNITNLHTHGLHVSPEGHSDNIFLDIKPEETIDLCFDIPPDHPAGTFWYHPHRHGSTALQVASGMAGALIVDGGLDEVPEIKAAMVEDREKVLVFQQIPYSLNPGGFGEVTQDDIYGTPDVKRARMRNRALDRPNTTINGVIAPVIRMRPGEIQRWRCVHAGLDRPLDLAIIPPGAGGPWWLYEIAADGIALGAINKQQSILLQPGYRSDFLVQSPPDKGTYLLTGKPVPAGRSINKVAQAVEYIAKVVVDGDAVVPAMVLPRPDRLKKYARPPVEDTEVAGRPPRTFSFLAQGQTFTINGKKFDKDHVDFKPQLGTAEEWRLSSKQDVHPFHIHVNPFEVIRKDGRGKVVTRVWKDTMVLTEDDDEDHPIFVRMRFQTFAGKTVLHCHNLIHEDQGMMMALQIEGKSPPSRCDTGKQTRRSSPLRKAPDWALRDGRGSTHHLAEFGQRKLLLVFVRGISCEHCRGQLAALADRRKDLEADELRVIGICPDSVEDLRRVLEDDPSAAQLPFLLLSDSSLETFRKYGCYDGRTLHGTFLLDGQRLIRWQDIADQPYMSIDGVLSESRRLRQPIRP